MSSAPPEEEPPLKELVFRPLALPDDAEPALKLISDAIAQQSLLVSRYLLRHPVYFIAPFTVIMCWIFERNYASSRTLLEALARSLIYHAGVAVAMFSIVGKVSRGYFVKRAEEVGNARGLQEFFPEGQKGYIAQWGGDIVGVVTFDYTGRKQASGKRKAEIKALTVMYKYRAEEAGVGSGLLEKVIDEAAAAGVNEVVFATPGPGVAFGYDYVPVRLRGPLKREWARTERLLTEVLKAR
ncbi:hypothetical protein DFH27DRAFT_545442 [Peziza echinospora]|nr:hypothetical protein DFH27DRAFT_545442 [Peziza echinospora]